MNCSNKLINELCLFCIMPNVEHHIHQRKRIHEDKQPFPHPDKKIRYIDNMAMVNAVVMPLTVLPQIYRIFYYQVVDGISLLMWVLFALSCLVMLVYGIVHKSKELIVLNVCWTVMNVIVIAGVIIYG